MAESNSSDESDYEWHKARNPHQRNIKDKLRKQRLSNASFVSGSTVTVKGYTEDPDPELLDTYDFFYKTTKGLLVLFQIMGVMPIERSGVARTTFRCSTCFFFFIYIYIY